MKLLPGWFDLETDNPDVIARGNLDYSSITVVLRDRSECLLTKVALPADQLSSTPIGTALGPTTVRLPGRDA